MQGFAKIRLFSCNLGPAHETEARFCLWWQPGQTVDDDGPVLTDFIDMKHPLVRMADKMQWEIFENHWRQQFSGAGGPMANSGRRVAALLMLKHMEALSDERLMV